MPTPGTKPKPRELKQRDGTFRPDRDPEPVQMTVPGEVMTDLTEPPADLPETAKTFWREAVPTLAQVGLISQVDKAALEMLSVQYARAKQAGRVVKEQGHLSRGSTGQLSEHPSLKTERESALNFLRFAEQYGLTPVARTRLGLAELQRRSLQEEMAEAFGKPELKPAAKIEQPDLPKAGDKK